MSTLGPAAGGSDDEEPDLIRFGELDYAAAYTGRLHTVLMSAGYCGELVTDPGSCVRSSWVRVWSGTPRVAGWR